jgi:hypothetical protein
MGAGFDGGAGFGHPDYVGPYSSYQKTVAPTVGDDISRGYVPGSEWVDGVGEDAYVCLKNPAGAAVWLPTTFTTSAGVPDPYTPPGGDWSLDGDFAATGDVQGATVTAVGALAAASLAAATATLTYVGPADAFSITLATELGSRAIVVSEDNAIRTPTMVTLTSAVLRTGDIVSLVNPGGGHGLLLLQSGAKDAIRVSLATSLVTQAMTVIEDDEARSSAMIEWTTQPNRTGPVLLINNDATTSSVSVLIDHEGDGDAIDAAYAGSGRLADLRLDGTEAGAVVLRLRESAYNRTAAFCEIIRDAIATGPVLDITPGGSVAALRVRGGAIDLSRSGDNHERVVSLADGKINFYASNGTHMQLTGGGVHVKDGALYIQSQAAAEGHAAAHFQIWVKSDTPNTLYFQDDNDQDVAAFQDSSVARDTAFLIYDVDNDTLERVSVGVADSGGGGKKLLCIPN